MKQLIEDTSPNSTPKDVLLALTQKNKGVFIGEVHLDSAKEPETFRASDLVKDNLSEASKSGLKILFLEHFYTKDQHALDDYMQTGNRNTIYQLHLDNLKQATPHIDWDTLSANPASQTLFKRQIDRILDIVDHAQKNGVKVMALDNFDFANAVADRGDVNPHWAQYIKDTTQDTPNSHYWILAGAAHSGGENGLDNLLQIPSMDIDSHQAIEGYNQVKPSSEIGPSIRREDQADYVFKLGPSRP